MANNYLQFSAALHNLTAEQAQWLEALVEEGEKDEADFEFKVAPDPRNKDAFCARFIAEEAGEPAHVTHVVQLFMVRFDIKEPWTFTWSNTCSKMREGEFGGGGAVVTQELVHMVDALEWVNGVAEWHINNALKAPEDQGART